MKRFTLVFQALFLVFSIIAQSPCVNSSGAMQNDELPGCAICNFTYSGTTGGYTPDTLGLDFPCGTIDGNQWFSVYANEQGKIQTSLRTGPCLGGGGLGAEIIFYDLNLNPVSDCFDHCENGGLTEIFEATGLVPGEQYFMMIDPCFPEDSCMMFFTIRDQNILPNGYISGFSAVPNQVNFCIFDEALFYISPLRDVSIYEWKIPNNVQVLEGGNEQDTFVSVKFIDSGSSDIEVTPVVGCRKGLSAIIKPRVPMKISKTEVICPGDSLIIGDSIFAKVGEYEVIIPNRLSFKCDSIVLLDLQIPDTSRPKIFCVQEPILNAISIGWDRKTLVDSYEVYINDSLVSVQKFIGYIYQYKFPGEKIDIKIQSIGGFGCDFMPGNATCFAPDISNSVDIFEIKVSVFPNPSTGIFEVFFRENSYGAKDRIERIEVFDFSGRKQKEVFESKVDLSEFRSGVYFLKIKSVDKISIIKVFKI